MGNLMSGQGCICTHISSLLQLAQGSLLTVGMGADFFKKSRPLSPIRWLVSAEGWQHAVSAYLFMVLLEVRQLFT